MEKLSEKHIREEKVKNFKKLAMAQITEHKQSLKNLLKIALKENNDKEINDIVFEYNTLNLFEVYLKSPYCLTEKQKVDIEKDVIIYVFPTKEIDVLLDGFYNISYKFVDFVQDKFKGLNDDIYFSIPKITDFLLQKYEFVSATEICMYKENIKKELEINEKDI